MSLAAALEREAQARPTGAPCGVKRLLETLSDEEAAALRSALPSDMQHAAISRALADEGHRISGLTISRHRRGLCSCDAR